ncbi:glycosyltransferase [Bowmanella pacifica]|uniref:Glycosyl transferase n=1 Tax=Bowmanella pacifica TaxID=502051 RepID=A0A917Z4I0_9ALTE|nr:glycosyltransferase [Bowmanella pacifica]GGO74850.1 glycosyl transferase [Bowmanella pacifica]
MPSNDKTLLVIGYVWPEPNSSAAGSRMLQLLSVFRSAGYQIVYGSAAESSQHAVDLAGLGVEAVTLSLNCASFDDYIRHLQPDVVMFDRFMMEEQFGWRVEQHCPNALRILDSEDLHFLRHARHLALKQGERLSNTHLYNELAKREIAAILRCDITLVISEFEWALLRDVFNIPAEILHYCPFMQGQVSASQTLAYEQRGHFISIGNFRHAPNWDAVLYLKESIWPLIRQQLPHAELHVYGAYPPPKATALHNPKQGFLVKGWATDALSVVGQARVMLAPLRFGAGLKGKLIDAALCQTPAVTSSIGAEGMYAELPPGLLVADDAQAFAAQAVGLYQHKNQWQALSECAGQLLPARFSKAEHGPRLLACIAQVSDNLATCRQANFFGSMLRHHSLKSTQYMAQWIEAKNRLKALQS